MPKLIVEVCCGSADDVIEAQEAGAHRVEPNSNLSLGGLTLSLGTLRAARVGTGLPIAVMARPWGSAFLYTAAEFCIAPLDAEALLANGADGIAFGFLNSDGTVDVGRCREMLYLAGENQTAFHRAIDVMSDWRAAIDLFCEPGVTRTPTSGRRASVSGGVATVVEIIRYAHGRIEILPGGGIRTHSMQEIASKTGCTQIHISPHRVCLDPSALGNLEIHFGLPGSHEDRYQVLDADESEKMCSLAYTD